MAPDQEASLRQRSRIATRAFSPAKTERVGTGRSAAWSWRFRADRARWVEPVAVTVALPFDTPERSLGSEIPLQADFDERKVEVRQAVHLPLSGLAGEHPAVRFIETPCPTIPFDH